jgi:hypothetical protein
MRGSVSPSVRSISESNHHDATLPTQFLLIDTEPDGLTTIPASTQHIIERSCTGALTG